MSGAGDFDYERSGAGYAGTRRTDPRIAAVVHGALGSARSVLNVGAGAGSYEPDDRAVVALEPSAAMRAQRRGGHPVVEWIAERLPFADASFDAAMATVTVHQWRDPVAGLYEMRRVSRGPVVVLTFDGDALCRFWLADYVPELMDAERRRYPALEVVADALGGPGLIYPVPVPRDCLDGFTEAYFARPEAFLDPAVRRGQSAWGFVGDGVEDRFVGELRRDLETGEWDRRYGSFRTRAVFEGSLRLVAHTPPDPAAARARRGD